MKQPHCKDCGKDLDRVYILDEGNQRLRYVGFEYTHEPPKVSGWTGEVKNLSGVVHAYLCGGCRRVYWYAHPGETKTRG